MAKATVYPPRAVCYTPTAAHPLPSGQRQSHGPRTFQTASYGANRLGLEARAVHRVLSARLRSGSTPLFLFEIGRQNPAHELRSRHTKTTSISRRRAASIIFGGVPAVRPRSRPPSPANRSCNPPQSADLRWDPLLVVGGNAGLQARPSHLAVLVWKLDRWGRSVAHSIRIIQELVSLGIRFLSHTESIDTGAESPCRAFFCTLFAAFAEMEREIIRERVRAGVRAAKAQGTALGRPRRVFRRGEAQRLRGGGPELAQDRPEAGTTHVDGHRRLPFGTPVAPMASEIRRLSGNDLGRFGCELCARHPLRRSLRRRRR